MIRRDVGGSFCLNFAESEMPRPRARVSRSPSSSLPEEEDSEVDEWEQDRQLVQQGTSKQFEQDSAADSDELDEDEDDEDISEEEDGVGQYLEDEGEVMEEDEDEEVRSFVRRDLRKAELMVCCLIGTAGKA